MNKNNNKIENFFRNIISNALIIAIIFSFLSVSLKRKNKVLSVSNSEYNGTIYAGDRSKNYVSIMINVYWGTEYVEQMLDLLKEKNIKTTFFIGGTWANVTPVILKRIYSDGHEIGNHGYTHKEHAKISYEKNYEEINNCHEVVKEILGIDMKLFAPPGGSYNENTVKSATNLGYKTIMWTRDTIDWRDKNEDLIYNRAVADIKGGDLILMHPTKESVGALKRIIDYTLNNDLQIRPVSDVIV